MIEELFAKRTKYQGDWRSNMEGRMRRQDQTNVVRLESITGSCKQNLPTRGQTRGGMVKAKRKLHRAFWHSLQVLGRGLGSGVKRRYKSWGMAWLCDV